jgi:hypothetical protein
VSSQKKIHSIYLIFLKGLLAFSGTKALRRFVKKIEMKCVCVVQTKRNYYFDNNNNIHRQQQCHCHMCREKLEKIISKHLESEQKCGTPAYLHSHYKAMLVTYN